MPGVTSVIAAASKTTTTSAAAAAAAAASSSATTAINFSTAAAVATAVGNNGLWGGANNGLGAIFSTRGGAISTPSDADAAAGVPLFFDRPTDDSPSKPTLMTAVSSGGAGSEQKFPRNMQKRHRMPLSRTLGRLAAVWGAVPQGVRYGTSACAGNLLFFFIDKMLWHHFMIPYGTNWLPPVLHSSKETVNFFVAYLMQIWAQHLLNATLVYGLETIATRSKYTSTLIGTYGAYSAALVGSTLLNAALMSRGLGKDLAFITTLFVFGVVNYFVLGWIMLATSQDKPKPRKQTDSSLPGMEYPQRGGASLEEPLANSFRRTNSGTAIHRKQPHPPASLEVPMASAEANSSDIKEEKDDEDDDDADGVDSQLLMPSHNGARLRRVRTGGSADVEPSAPATKAEAVSSRPAAYRRRANGPPPRKRTDSNMPDNDDDAVVDGMSVDPGSDAALMHLAMSGDAEKVNKQ